MFELPKEPIEIPDFPEEYELYQSTNPKDLLTREEFNECWNCIAEKEHKWFLEQFHAGKPVLTREIFDADSGFRAVASGRVRPEIRRMVESALKEMDLTDADKEE